MTLNGKSIVITGAFGTLGSAVVSTAAAAGARVALIDRAVQAPAASAGCRSYGNIDLTDQGATKATFNAIAAEFGRIDALVNIAGGFRWEKIAEGQIDTWDFLYNINLKTALCASKAALPHLIACGNGRVINIGAGASTKAGLGMGAYAASKAGVAKLTEALAEELKDRGITVNAILPSIIDTPANRADMAGADFSRWVKPEQIADLIAFLLSDRAAAITGALIPVNGRM
jgi:NAD(P)-dependent dehydrogenase (short-subunit alcohol dehydrogenase family)